VLANIYLHYTLDLWFERVVHARQRGRCRMIRYADDFVACFEYRHEAEAFEKALKERLAKFGLEAAAADEKPQREAARDVELLWAHRQYPPGEALL
jgi:hypothetical protein